MKRCEDLFIEWIEIVEGLIKEIKDKDNKFVKNFI